MLSWKLLAAFELETKEKQKASGGDKKTEEFKVSVTQLVAQPIPREKTAVELAANATGANKDYVRLIKVIEREAPERLKEIKAGTATVKQICRELEAQRKQSLEVGNPKPLTTALQLSTKAINQLTRIKEDDTKRVEALLEVRDYIDKLLQDMKVHTEQDLEAITSNSVTVVPIETAPPATEHPVNASNTTSVTSDDATLTDAQKHQIVMDLIAAGLPKGTQCQVAELYGSGSEANKAIRKFPEYEKQNIKKCKTNTGKLLATLESMIKQVKLDS